MKKTILLLLIFLIFISCSHKNINVLNSCSYISENDKFNSQKEYTLILISGYGCGYCNLALKQLDEINEDNLQIIIYEFGSEEDILKGHGEFVEKYTFINTDECNLFKITDANYFPEYRLYKEGERIWKRTGYYKDTPKVISEEIEN
ncbi:hypothetical protein [Aureivirga marina]|uniref:hypothetical protein n=1 Tax=Aureivirga marina TaxID=1182451 RepID=UPI0018CA719F|nr:hypothetical protein [Aureivirga marina]